jgi:hypothetical protein
MNGNENQSRLNIEPIIPKIAPKTPAIIPIHAPNNPAASPNNPPKIPIQIGKVKIISRMISKVELERVINLILAVSSTKISPEKKMRFLGRFVHNKVLVRSILNDCCVHFLTK